MSKNHEHTAGEAEQSPDVVEEAVEETTEAATEAAVEETVVEPVAPDQTTSNDFSQEAPMEQGLLPEGSVSDAPSGEEHALRDVKSLLEAIVYVTDEPLSAQQIATAMEQPLELVQKLLNELVEEYSQPHRGLTVRELAGGYKMGTKPEHHESLRSFVKSLKPSLKLSLAALETLAVIAYKQPITGPEIMEIRGVQGAGVLKTLLDRKLIATGGRKNVVGKPMLYKTTKEFLLQFGLNGLAELPTLKEFEELKRLALNDEDVLGGGAPDAPATPEQEEAAAVEAVAATKDGVPDSATADETKEPTQEPAEEPAQEPKEADVTENA
jgi:segregation and condensation protein B